MVNIDAKSNYVDRLVLNMVRVSDSGMCKILLVLGA